MLVTGEIDVILNSQAVDVDQMLVDFPFRVGTLVSLLPSFNGDLLASFYLDAKSTLNWVETEATASYLLLF